MEKKELIKKLKERVKKNGKRIDHLTYAFLRNKPYVLLERKNDEDSHNVIGLHSSLKSISYNIAYLILEESGMKYPKNTESYEVERKLFVETTISAMKWLLQKYSDLPYKEGDKLYTVTRQDLIPGSQAVQAMHASHEFAVQHTEEFLRWQKESNYLAFLSIANEDALKELIKVLDTYEVKYSVFREPDLDNTITAVAFERKGRIFCASFKLALS